MPINPIRRGWPVPFPGYGNVPIFTPPFNPDPSQAYPVSPGVPSATHGQQPVPPSVDPQLVQGANADPSLDPRNLATHQPGIFTPDQVPVDNKSRLRKFFDNLVSQPNSHALLTMGSVLSSAPQPGESPLGQAVRGLSGAVSTRGLYAQAQAAQAEQQRRARLEQQKASDDQLVKVSGVNKEQRSIDQKDTELDIERSKVDATTEQNRINQEGLQADRAERRKEAAARIKVAEDRAKTAKAAVDAVAQGRKDDLAFKEEQLTAQREYQKAQLGVAAARIAASKTNANEYRRYTLAIQMLDKNSPISDIDKPLSEKLKEVQSIADGLKGKDVGGVVGTPEPQFGGPVKGDKRYNPKTDQTATWNGSGWDIESGRK